MRAMFHILRAAALVAAVFFSVDGFAGTFTYFQKSYSQSPRYVHSTSEVCDGYISTLHPNAIFTKTEVNRCELQNGSNVTLTYVLSGGGYVWQAPLGIVGSKQTLVCTEPMTIAFHGDNPPTCEPPPDPCAGLNGSNVNIMAACGTWSCPSQPISVDGDWRCPGNPPAWTINWADPPGSANINSCNALYRYTVPSKTLLKASEASSSDHGTLLCEANYQFDGTKGNGDPWAPPGSTGDALNSNPNSNGCPTGYTFGQVNGVDTCVKNSSGTGTGTGTGTGGTGTGTGGTGTGGTGTGTGTGGTGTGTGGTGTGGTGTGGTGTGGSGTGSYGNEPGICESNVPNDIDCASGTCNPLMEKCGQSGSFNGSTDCETPPQCDGDPVACGGIIQNWKDICALTKITDEQREQAKTAGDAAQGAYEDFQDEADDKAAGFFADFQSKLNGGNAGQCLSDVTVALGSHSFEIPFSKGCEFMRFLRVLVLISAYMAAAAIVFRAM